MRPTPTYGGCIFAEAPDRPAPDARLLWHADLDPDTLPVSIEPVECPGPDHILLADLAPWLFLTHEPDGREYAVLSDGRRHLRLDVLEGSLRQMSPVLIHFHMSGLVSAHARLVPLRRLLHVLRYRRFPSALFPPDPRSARWIDLLRVHDAVRAGASQREIGSVLYGEARIAQAWDGRTDALRSRVRRMVRDAAAMAQGGYRRLLQRRL